MADFENRLISGIFVVFFERFFAQNIPNKLAELILTCFRHFKFLDQIEYFAKAIAHGKDIAIARWPTFKIVLYLEYLLFFQAVFCTEYF